MNGLCWLTLLLVGQASATAAEAGDPALAGELRNLVEQLEAPQRARRDDAERRLLDLGAAALSDLPVVDDRSSAELRLRLGRVRRHAEALLAEGTRLPRTVTLSRRGMSLAELSAALQAQTGNRVFDYRHAFGQEPRDVRIDTDFDHVAFWPALDRALDQAGLTLYPFTGQAGLAVVAKAPNTLPRYGRACYTGAFRIAPQAIVAVRNIDDPSRDALQLKLDVAWEPRLRPILLALPNDRLNATGETGARLALANPQATQEVNVGARASQAEVTVQLALPDRSVRRIASLTGTFEALLPGEPAEFRFPHLEGAEKQVERRADVTVAFERARVNQGVCEVPLLVSFAEPGRALESHRIWIYGNPAWLEDKQGRKIAYSAVAPTLQTEQAVGLLFSFHLPDDSIEGLTFVYRTPSAILDAPVAFELHNLELP